MPAELQRMHKYLLENGWHLGVSDQIRAVVESEWPELAHKLPPKHGSA